MIAKRLKIAELLLKNNTYEEIRILLKVSPMTIARVQEWLKMSGGGYRKIISRAKFEEEPRQRDRSMTAWKSIKKIYPAYFWPEVLLEEIIKSARKRDRERLQRVVGEMEAMKEKGDLYKKLKRVFSKNIHRR